MPGGVKTFYRVSVTNDAGPVPSKPYERGFQ